MKKIKLLTPLFAMAALGAAVTPAITSCSSKSDSSNGIIPTNLLNLSGQTCDGLIFGTNVSNYNTLSIPEGTKYISEAAFIGYYTKDVDSENMSKKRDQIAPWNYGFVLGDSNSSITTIKLPSTIESIGGLAFANCNSVRTLDLSDWDTDTIHRVQISEQSSSAGGAFFKNAPYGRVIMKEGLSETSKSTLKAKLVAAGLTPLWFETKETDGKATLDGWNYKETETGFAKFDFKITDKELEKSDIIYAVVTKTESTKGVDISNMPSPLLAIPKVDADTSYIMYGVTTGNVLAQMNNIAPVYVTLKNQHNDGDYVKFDISLISVNESGTKANWIKTYKDNKLTFKQSKITIDNGVSWDYGANGGKLWKTETTAADPISQEGSTIPELNKFYVKNLNSNHRILLDEFFSMANTYYTRLKEAIATLSADMKINEYKFSIGDITTNLTNDTFSFTSSVSYDIEYPYEDPTSHTTISYNLANTRTAKFENIKLGGYVNEKYLKATYPYLPSSTEQVYETYKDWKIKSTSDVYTQNYSTETLAIIGSSHCWTKEINEFSPTKADTVLIDEYPDLVKYFISLNNVPCFGVEYLYSVKEGIFNSLLPSVATFEPIFLSKQEIKN